MNPAVGLNKYELTKKKYFMPEVVKWYMPVEV
jgi:hypothetical protein